MSDAPWLLWPCDTDERAVVGRPPGLLAACVLPPRWTLGWCELFWSRLAHDDPIAVFAWAEHRRTRSWGLQVAPEYVSVGVHAVEDVTKRWALVVAVVEVPHRTCVLFLQAAGE